MNEFWHRDTWMVFRIMAEFVEGFETLGPLSPAVSVFGGARCPESSEIYAQADEIGFRLAQHGFAVLTGGGPGAMEGANRGARRGGALFGDPGDARLGTPAHVPAKTGQFGGYISVDQMACITARSENHRVAQHRFYDAERLRYIGPLAPGAQPLRVLQDVRPGARPAQPGEHLKDHLSLFLEFIQIK